MKIKYPLTAILLTLTLCASGHVLSTPPACAYQPDSPVGKHETTYRDAVKLAFENAAMQCESAGAPEEIIQHYETLSEEAACEEKRCKDLAKPYRELFHQHWCGYHEGITQETTDKEVIKIASTVTIKKCHGPAHDWIYSKLMSCYHHQEDQCMVLAEGMANVFSPVYE